jgi:excisionase family DNA binding protein
VTNSMPAPKSEGNGTVKEFVTVKEFASRYDLHRDTVYRLLREGYLVGVRVGGSWRLPGEYTGNKIRQNKAKYDKLRH